MAGTGFEVTKSPYLGKHGHLAVRTNNIRRANPLSRQSADFVADKTRQVQERQNNRHLSQGLLWGILRAFVAEVK